ncbi:hypothetical protein DW037_02525 [Collinsella sp. AF39-11AT]|nr:hypothetical protein DW037_02525 [Collinsella sp. AF39-11AT]
MKWFKVPPHAIKELLLMLSWLQIVSGSKTLALSRTMEWTSIHRHLKSNRDMNSIGAPSRMTVLLMTEIPFRIKILIHGCNMNFQMYGLQIA